MENQQAGEQLWGASKQGKRVGFFLDPTKSDAELAELIMEIAQEHFDLPDGDHQQENSETKPQRR